MKKLDYPTQSQTEHSRLVETSDDAIHAADLISSGNIRLVVFSRDHWLLPPEHVYPTLRALDVERPLGTPDTHPDKWWAIVGYSGRWDYRLIPLGDSDPAEWERHGCRSGEKYEVRSQKADVACVYECSSLLDALLTRGEHYSWTKPPQLGELVEV